MSTRKFTGDARMFLRRAIRTLLFGYLFMFSFAASACSPGDLIAETTDPVTVSSDDYNVYNRQPLITIPPGNKMCIDTSWTQSFSSVLTQDQVGVYFRVGLKDYHGIASTKYLKKVDTQQQEIPYVTRPDGTRFYCNQPGAFSVSGCPNAEK